MINFLPFMAVSVLLPELTNPDSRKMSTFRDVKSVLPKIVGSLPFIWFEQKMVIKLNKHKFDLAY